MTMIRRRRSARRPARAPEVAIAANATTQAEQAFVAQSPTQDHDQHVHAARAPPLSDDVLIGNKAIAAEIGIDERKCFYWLQRGYIPAQKVGGTWTATRSRLRRHFQRERAR